MALTNPYDLKAGKACVPDLLDIPSFKFLSVTRGTFQAGTNIGYVFVKADPTSDLVSVVFTDSTFAGTTVTGNNAVTGVNYGTQTEQPFLSTQFGGAGFMWRLVGGGLRVRYLGTELNRSGRQIPFRVQVGGVTGVAANGASQFLARQEISPIPSIREWASVTFLPTTNLSQYAYNSNVSKAAATGASGLDATLGFFIDGAVTGNAWEWEYWGHYEVASTNGDIAPAGVTPSHADLPGLSAIRNTLESNLPAGESPGLDYEYYFNLIKQYAPEDMSSIVSGVYKVGKQVGPMLLTY